MSESIVEALVAFIIMIVATRYFFVNIELMRTVNDQDEKYQKYKKTMIISAVVLAISLPALFVFGGNVFHESQQQRIEQEQIKKEADMKKQQEKIEKQQLKEQQEAEQKAKHEQEQIEISENIRSILSGVPHHKDDVEQRTVYQSWGNGPIPARTTIHWKIYMDSNAKLSPLYCEFVQFTTGTNWIFWSKMLFSDGNGNKWAKTLNTFAGQSEDGKTTDVVYGGKYENWSGKMTDIKDGLEILANADKPIIRLSGKEYYADVRMTNNDIQKIKLMLHLNELIEKLDNRTLK
jgi:hypothetical protein